jgi:cytidylate kinase
VVKPFIIAIDGPNGSGKGTLARNLGRELNFPMLDTGLLYRGVGYLMLQKSHDLKDDKEALHCADELHELINTDILGKPELRSIECGNAASIVSAYPSVRQSLFDLQRGFALHPPGDAKGAILDGRDIGTVICPDADAKFFVTAQPEIRAERRAREEYGEAWEKHFKDVLQMTMERDKRDSERVIAPLKPATDAVIIDTSHITAEDVLSAVLEIVKKQMLERYEKSPKNN